MTFWQYFWYIDVPVSMLIFIIILVVLNKRFKKRRLEAISEELLDEYYDAYNDLAEEDLAYEDLAEDDLTESNFMTSPADLEAKQFPKWLLNKASYEQLDDFIINNHFKNTKFHLSNFTWDEAKRLVTKLEKLQLKEYGNGKSVVSELINDLRQYMDFWA